METDTDFNDFDCFVPGLGCALSAWPSSPKIDCTNSFHIWPLRLITPSTSVIVRHSDSYKTAIGQPGPFELEFGSIFTVVKERRSFLIMGLDLYYFPVSVPCRAVYMAATSLGIQFNIKPINIMAGEHLRPDFLKINPQHTIPLIDDNGFILSESRVIMQYLANAYAKQDNFYPKGTRKRAVVDHRLSFDMGTLNKAFGEVYVPIIFENQPLKADKVKKFNEALGYLEGYLKEARYAAGDALTIADFSIIATLSSATAAGHDLSQFPRVQEYMGVCKREIKGWQENEAGAKQFGDFVKTKLAQLKQQQQQQRH